MGKREGYKDEIKYLIENGIENVMLDCADGKITLAELLSNYAFEWYSQNDDREYDRDDY